MSSSSVTRSASSPALSRRPSPRPRSTSSRCPSSCRCTPLSQRSATSPPSSWTPTTSPRRPRPLSASSALSSASTSLLPCWSGPRGLRRATASGRPTGTSRCTSPQAGRAPSLPARTAPSRPSTWACCVPRCLFTTTSAAWPSGPLSQHALQRRGRGQSWTTGQSSRFAPTTRMPTSSRGWARPPLGGSCPAIWRASPCSTLPCRAETPCGKGSESTAARSSNSTGTCAACTTRRAPWTSRTCTRASRCARPSSRPSPPTACETACTSASH
mmetsp:Transcript_23944/g.74562  ORF Transcript_23944/g.74562 Transcript_23944/m.74562 type:complete len:271 (-) Transcript_23944:44-856(-)